MSEPHIVVIPPGCCTNCLYAHFKDDNGGFCDFVKIGHAPKALSAWMKDLELPIARKEPYTHCPAWQPRKMELKLGL